MRKCTRCKIEKEETEFHVQWRNNRNRYYPCRHCRECDKKLCAEYYKNNREKLIKKTAEWVKNNPERDKENRKNYFDNNRQKIYARGEVAYRLRLGEIVKPKNCENCEIEKKLSAHHTDYSKPLDIQWLCKECHLEKHRRLL